MYHRHFFVLHTPNYISKVKITGMVFKCIFLSSMILFFFSFMRSIIRPQAPTLTKGSAQKQKFKIIFSYQERLNKFL